MRSNLLAKHLQSNYSHPAADPPTVIIDDYVILQFVDVLRARRVYLLHTVSHYHPLPIVVEAVRERIQWLIDDARNTNCYGIHIHDGSENGVSHDFIRQMLHSEFGFIFLPHVGVHWLQLTRLTGDEETQHDA